MLIAVAGRNGRDRGVFDCFDSPCFDDRFGAMTWTIADMSVLYSNELQSSSRGEADLLQRFPDALWSLCEEVRESVRTGASI